MTADTKIVRRYKSIAGFNAPPSQMLAEGVPEQSGTCSDAAPFALQVKDDSMQPEFDQGCIVVVDPTGVACDCAFVLVDIEASAITPSANLSAGGGRSAPILLRQLRRDASCETNAWSICALNPAYPNLLLGPSLDAVIGVVVQRAGRRRSYHKRY